VPSAARFGLTGRAGWAVVTGWVVVLAAVLLWPLTRGGYLLGHDMVFTPEQPLNLQAIGVSSAPPRAVPLDALVAMAERVVDGAVVGRLALLVPVLAAGIGVAAVLGAASLPGKLAASTAAVWNPYVVERLALGQWALIWCYAALPWLVLAVARGRGPTGWLQRGLALGAASITPTGGVLATVSAVAVAGGLGRPRREVLATAGLGVALQLPWLMAAAVSTASATSDPAGVGAFAARGEHLGGVLLSLLAGGGIWDADAVPDSRGGGLAWLWLGALGCAAVYGLPRLVGLLGRRLVATLAVLAAAGLLLAVLPSAPGGAALVRGAVEHVPGAGLLRDAQKWLVPLVLFEALAFGAATVRLAERLASLEWRTVLAVAAAALPLIALPDAPATLRPTLEPVHYPSDWAAVSDRMTGGDAAVVPWGSYRTFGWAPGRSVLDPAPRLLPVPTVVDDRLAINGTLLAGEDPRAAAVGRALAAGLRSSPGLRRSAGPRLAAGLAAQGISWVVVEHGTPGPVPDLAGLQQTYGGRQVSLYRVSGQITPKRAAAGRVAAVIGGYAVAGAVLLALLGWSIGARRRDQRPVQDPGRRC
jgi:hypothetical protein